MKTWPLKFRELADQHMVMADDAGGYFVAQRDFVERYALGRLSADDAAFLQEKGHSFQEEGDLAHTAFLSRWSQRQYVGGGPAYVILIPTSKM